MHKFLIAAALAIGGATLTLPALAGEPLAPAVAAQLDRAPAEYAMTAAKERRLMMMQETMRRQNRQQYRGHGGYGGGYGRAPHHAPRGYGPPPGYRHAPPPPYGYGRPRW